MFTILSNSLFLLFIFAVLVIIARRLPEAAQMLAEEEESRKKQSLMLRKKGVAVPESGQFSTFLVQYFRRIWKVILEAKGLVPAAKVRYRIKKIFRSQVKQPVPPTEESMSDIVVNEAPVKISEAWLLDQIKQFPGDQNLYIALGNLYMQRKSYQEAIGIFTVLADRDKLHAGFAAKLGFAYLMQGDFKNAAAAYRTAVQLDASHPSRFYNLGLAEKALGNHDEAKAAFKSALDLEPSNQKYQDVYLGRKTEAGPKTLDKTG